MSSTTGSCLCRAITYKIEGPPIYIGICHCENCRKWTDSFFTANSGYMKSQFSLLSGEEDVMTYLDSATTSGMTLKRQFCGKCGSTLFTVADDHERMKDVIMVYYGSQDGTDVRGINNEKWAPITEGFCSERAPYLPEFDCNFKFDKMIMIKQSETGEIVRA